MPSQTTAQGHGSRPDRTAWPEYDIPARSPLQRERAPVAVLPGGNLPQDSAGERTACLVWGLPADGRVGDLPAWRAFTGQSQEAVRGHGWLAAVHPQDRDRAVRVWEQALATGVPFAAEFRIRRYDGVYRWFSVHAMPRTNAHGRVRGWAGSAVDITAHQEHAQEREERLAHALAAHWAGERNRLLAQEQAAHKATAAANAQLRALQALTDTALSHLALDELLRELLDRVTAVMGVDNVAIFLLDDDGRTLTMQAARGLLEEEVGRVRIPVGQGFAGRIAAAREPLIVDDTTVFDLYGMYPRLRDRLHAVVGVPLLAEDLAENHLAHRLVGIIHVGSAAPRRFTEADVQLLQRAADRIALAIGRARLYAAEQEARRQAETALARAQASEAQAAARAELLHTVLDTIADGVAVFDTEGRPILPVNRAYRELHALERAPAGFDALPAQERVCLFQVRNGATGPVLPFEESPSGRALRGEVVRGPGGDFRVRAFDGRELELNASAAPLREPDGRIVGAVLVLRDLTERNRLEREREEALRSREEWFHTMADTAPVLLWVAGPDALVTFLNAPWLRFTGRSLEQELGNGWAEGVHPDDFRRCLQTYLAAFHARQPFTMEYRLRRFDGQYRHVLDSGVPRYAPDGTFLGYIGSAIDITERVQLEREREAARANELALREVNQHMEAFLATAAHDLRNPVQAADGYVQLALRRLEQLKADQAERAPSVLPAARAQDVVEAEELAEARRSRRADPVQALDDSLRAAAQSTERLSRMVMLLFDVARARAGTLELQLAPCDLAALVREQVEAQRMATPGRTIQLEMRIMPDSVPVLADADRLGQVLANYLTNALKYSPDDAPVIVRLDLEDDRLARVAVRDAGPGLPPEEKQRIWEPFHRVPGVAVQSGSAGMAGSLGLGLHICKSIVEGHSGQVGVESTAGQGATFWFTLPLVRPTARRSAVPAWRRTRPR